MSLKQLHYNNEVINYYQTFGSLGHVLYCGGYNSTLQGTKASLIAHYCRANNIGVTLFDYYGCGNSSGDFFLGTISKWLDNTLKILATIRTPVIIVGSSMGGWLMAKAALSKPLTPIKGLVGIASAPDFTDAIPYSPAQLARDGVINFFGLTLSQAFLTDATSNFILKKPINVNIPVILLHGMQDELVHYNRSIKMAELLPDAKVILLKNSDHGMSDERAIKEIISSVQSLI